MRRVNHGKIIDTLSWYKILPLNGSRRIRVNRKLLQETEKSSKKFLEQSQKLGVSHRQFFRIWQIL